MTDTAQEDLITEKPDQDTPPPPPFHAVVNADLFRRAQMCVAQKAATRYFLEGVFIEPCPQGGATMVSTNGHHAVIIRAPPRHRQRLRHCALKQAHAARAEGGKKRPAAYGAGALGFL